MSSITFIPTVFSGTDNTNGGSIVWANPENVAVSDDNVALATGPLFETPAILTSLTLKVSTWKYGGASIAKLIGAGDTLNSLTVSVERHANGSAVDWYVKDAICQQYYGGAYAGTNLADTVNEWDGPPDGVSVDYLWNAALPTTAQVRAADYAFGIQVTMLPLVDADILANIDLITLTIDYTEVPPLGGHQVIRMGIV